MNFRDDDEAEAFLNAHLGAFAPPDEALSGDDVSPPPPAVDNPPPPMPGVVEGKAPPVAQKPAGDGELGRLQSSARKTRNSAMLGQAGANFADAFTSPGHRSSNSFWDKYAASGDDDIADYKARKTEDEANEKKRKEAEFEAVLADPDSVESQLYREFIGRTGVQLTGKESGKQLKQVVPLYGDTVRELGAGKRAEAQAAAAKAKLAEEERRRGEDRSNKLADTEAANTFRAGESRLQRAQSDTNAKTMAGTRGEAAASRADDKLDEKVRKLETRIPAEAASLRTKQSQLNKLIEGKHDIPGVGPIDGRIPNLFAGEEAGAIRQLGSGLIAQLLKLQSGAAVSEAEMERKKLELGMSSNSTEQQYRQGLKNLNAEIDATLKQHLASAPPEAQAEYERRGGLMPSQAQPPGGPVQMKFPDGSVHSVPAEKLEAARRKGGVVADGP